MNRKLPAKIEKVVAPCPVCKSITDIWIKEKDGDLYGVCSFCKSTVFYLSKDVPQPFFVIEAFKQKDYERFIKV